jgi:2-hydroxychromene-2-carboxylate isomerase
MSSITDQEQPSEIEFFFDIMCPYAYQTSRWIRDVQAQVGFAIKWRFFSLEEVNREEGKPHPWEREFAYGWTPMRVAAWLRRQDNDWCGRFYEVCGRALHVEGRRHYDREVALELLAAAGLPTEAWDAALADPTTSDEVRADHEHAVTVLAVVLPAPEAEKARELWDITLAYARFPGLFEIKTPKTDADMAMIGQIFSPYINARQWRTIQNPAR